MKNPNSKIKETKNEDYYFIKKIIKYYWRIYL